ncbi:PrsW family glutamic-type intramembrane protease [Merismopedia glauca]|uniref:PrsW family intramembrane metalloprotease n=1 Tax=Merismopedia glauca CCAP 1448/3 TaxID=1296344 RepID=A0A2T1C7E8_9CYAN|nr:PrsW family glutamic-type intramembrane protease [Merismopedia glauca]PSB04190.1 PrsW family intramembrane metalloprotease [Merismopedia glauca CCAP 1448/3]
MIGQTPGGFLQQLLGSGAAGLETPPFGLPSDREIFIGRDPSCQLVLDISYSSVSRRHASIRPLMPPPPVGIPVAWEICDLNSANGTFVNGQKLMGCRQLQHSDRIVFGNNGPEFAFEYQQPSIPTQPYATPQYTPTAAVPPVPLPIPIPIPSPSSKPPDALSMTQLFPILSTGRDLKSKAFLVPGILMVLFVVGMFATIGRPVLFNLLLALAIASGAYYFVYQLCGKLKPWWWLISAALLTALLLIPPLGIIFPIWPAIGWFYRHFLPGDVFGLEQGNPSFSTNLVANIFGKDSYPTALITHFFGAGLAEELFKAVPIFIAGFIGSSFRSQRLGVWEPLDGILIGTASAVGFTLLETLGQYVPNIVSNITPRAGEGAAQLVGLQLLIPRILGSVAGHMAYSGYFGYFIGLSVIRPTKRWQILAIGYLSAAGLHALWNSSSTLNEIVSIVVGIVSYMFLAAAILKARALSPNRAQNFATRFIGK